MSAIKFRKRHAKFKITIALPKKFGSKGFITAIKSLRFKEALANLISSKIVLSTLPSASSKIKVVFLV